MKKDEAKKMALEEKDQSRMALGKDTVAASAKKRRKKEVEEEGGRRRRKRGRRKGRRSW